MTSAFEHFQHATVLIASRRYVAARAVLEKAIATIDKTGVDQHMRDDLEALLVSFSARPSKPWRQPAIWRNDDGTWSHHRDAERRWETRAAAAIDLRFHHEWERK